MIIRTAGSIGGKSRIREGHIFEWDFERVGRLGQFRVACSLLRSQGRGAEKRGGSGGDDQRVSNECVCHDDISFGWWGCEIAVGLGWQERRKLTRRFEDGLAQREAVRPLR